MGAAGWRPWTLGEQEARPIFRRAVDLGINFIDTADTYSAGESEKLVGKLVRPSEAEIERNPRARSARLRVAERTPLEQAA